MKEVFILRWTNKHGEDYFFDSSLEECEKRANEFIKKYYPKSKDYKDTEDFGPYDSFTIYSHKIPSYMKEEDLNSLFNVIFVNPQLMNKITESEL